MIPETTKGMIFLVLQKKLNINLWCGLDAEISPVQEPNNPNHKPSISGRSVLNSVSILYHENSV